MSENTENVAIFAPIIPTQYAAITRNGITFREDTPFETYIQIGKDLSRVSNDVQFIIGDWILFGKKSYGEKYKDALVVTGLDYSTLRDYASAANRIPLASRNPNLDFSHHRTVAKVKDPEKRAYWLRTAEEKHMPVTLLKKSIIADRVLDAATLAAEREAASKERGIPNIYNTVATLNAQIDAIEERKGRADTWGQHEQEKLLFEFKAVIGFRKRIGVNF